MFTNRCEIYSVSIGCNRSPLDLPECNYTSFNQSFISIRRCESHPWKW